jgi:hypothetical protein
VYISLTAILVALVIRPSLFLSLSLYLASRPHHPVLMSSTCRWKSCLLFFGQNSTVCVYRRCFSTVAAQHHKTSQTENVNDNIEQGVPREHGNEHVRSGILWDSFLFFLFLATPCITTVVEIFTEENHSRYMERGVKVNGSGKQKSSTHPQDYVGGMWHFRRPHWLCMISFFFNFKSYL